MPARRLVPIVLAAAAAAGALAWAFWPRAIAVDLAEVRRGPLQVTVTAEGMTRVRDPYLVTAPVSGIAARSPVEIGDAVVAGETVVALIEPAAPGFLDARARRQAEAAVSEAEAALRLAEANLARAEGDLAHAEAQFRRNAELASRGIVSQQMLEDTQIARDTARSAEAAARSAVELQQATLARMQAQLVGPVTGKAPETDTACCVEVLSPQSGTVLSVENESERLVIAGMPLVTIGDLGDLEIETDLLSSDAVRIAPGARAFLERWGGDRTVEARVRQVEPAGFTKISSLGIEEQRVRVRLDFVDPPKARPTLGDGYRVYVRLVLWEAEDVLQVPVSALFRNQGTWAVFRDVDGRARLTPVEVGHQNARDAQVMSGLDEGDRVVSFPGNTLEEGDRIRGRATD